LPQEHFGYKVCEPQVTGFQWLKSEELAQRADSLEGMLRTCRVCPHVCGVDRTAGETGICRSGHSPIIASYGPHFGEEPPISGIQGAGNIFFGNCNLGCVYCQNHQISQYPLTERHHEVDCRHLAGIMMDLAHSGCHNINLVSPTQFVPQIVRALSLAGSAGLSIPIVYNSNAFESVEVLRLLDGIVHVYLPDLKYADDEIARGYSKADNYVSRARTAIREMYRQMGSSLIFDDDGILLRGLITRLLVLPNDLAGIARSLQFIHDDLSPDVAISLMAQYYPTHRVVTTDHYPLLSRKINAAEWERAVGALDRLGMETGWLQDWKEAPDSYRPDFSDRLNPFKTAV
jgi:putative pyruvate formate lyase activating enzyme